VLWIQFADGDQFVVHHYMFEQKEKKSFTSENDDKPSSFLYLFTIELNNCIAMCVLKADGVYGKSCLVRKRKIENFTSF
jgi:hypothetical protein